MIHVYGYKHRQGNGTMPFLLCRVVCLFLQCIFLFQLWVPVCLLCNGLFVVVVYSGCPCLPVSAVGLFSCKWVFVYSAVLFPCYLRVVVGLNAVSVAACILGALIDDIDKKNLMFGDTPFCFIFLFFYIVLGRIDLRWSLSESKKIRAL